MSRSIEPTILTPGGRDRLEAELHHLKTIRRAEVAELFAQIQTSASGDAELELERGAAREEMALVEGRIAQLEGLLANATIVEPALREPGVAAVGARVTVEDEGEEDTYVLVSPAEASPRRGHISIASPVGAALCGRRAGDVVPVETPAGARELKVLRVE